MAEMGLNAGSLCANKSQMYWAWCLKCRKHSRNGSCYHYHNSFYHCKCVKFLSDFTTKLSQLGDSECPWDLFPSLQGRELSPRRQWIHPPAGQLVCNSVQLHVFCKLCISYLKQAAVYFIIRKGFFALSFLSTIFNSTNKSTRSEIPEGAKSKTMVN